MAALINNIVIPSMGIAIQRVTDRSRQQGRGRFFGTGLSSLGWLVFQVFFSKEMR